MISRPFSSGRDTVTGCGDRVGPEGSGAAGPRGAHVHSVPAVSVPHGLWPTTTGLVAGSSRSLSPHGSQGGRLKPEVRVRWGRPGPGAPGRGSPLGPRLLVTAGSLQVLPRARCHPSSAFASLPCLLVCLLAGRWLDLGPLRSPRTPPHLETITCLCLQGPLV